MAAVGSGGCSGSKNVLMLPENASSQVGFARGGSGGTALILRGACGVFSSVTI